MTQLSDMSTSDLDVQVAQVRNAVESFMRELDRISPPRQTIPLERPSVKIDGLAYLPCTEAIPAWLAAVGSTHDIKGVWEGLHATGRTDRLDTVSMTLAELASKGKIHRVSRGRYRAT